MSRLMRCGWIVILLFGVTGCSAVQLDEGLESITLFCNDRLANEGCTEDVTIEDAEAVRTFKHVLERAKKMDGMLDYEEEFEMVLEYRNGEERRFHLSLTRRREYMGLLVELTNTTQGYSIPAKEANKLRDIIYGQTAEAPNEQPSAR